MTGNSTTRIPYSYVHEHYGEMFIGRLPQAPGARYQCPCCDYYTLEGFPHSAVPDCPVCGWTFDIVMQHRDLLGSNRVFLEEARRNFATFGASERVRVPDTRPPRADEMP